MKDIQRPEHQPPEASQLADRVTLDDVASAAGLTEANLNAKTFIGGTPDAEGTGMQIPVGEKIGKYVVRAQLGEGGMGAVYLAYDPVIEREVAIKVLTQNACHSSVAAQRFLGEARAIGRLNHPHVVSIYDIDQWNGQYYLVMELLSGGSVASLTEEQGALPWKKACELVAQAASGLAAAHAAGMIHRDIKPENLMLSQDGMVKVVDFGLSKMLDSSNDPHEAVTKMGQILGTPQYMSPEQFEGRQIDARTDVYSLGATLFRLLTARFPYHDCRSIVQVMTSHLSKPAPVPTEYVPSLPAECDRIVARAMAKNPKDRYQTTAELAAELQALISGHSRQPATVDNEPAGIDRPLKSVLIVEPSRLQGAVLKDSLLRAGVDRVKLVQSQEAVNIAMEREVPDLLITAMQLPDGRGIDLLQNLCQRSLLSKTSVVLNSSDSTIEELVAAGPAACLVLASKKVKADEILRIVYAAGPSGLPNGAFVEAFDPLAVRIHVELDGGRVPDSLANIVRELQLLNVEVTIQGEPGVPTAAPAHLTLILRTAKTTTNDGVVYPAMLSSRSEKHSLLAAVQVDKQEIYLRSVGHQGALAVCQCVLDTPRMVRLLQACQI